MTTEQFRQLYAKAAKERQLRIRRAYRLWLLTTNIHPCASKRSTTTCQSIQPEWILIGEWSVSSGMTPLFDSGLFHISRMRSCCDPFDCSVSTKGPGEHPVFTERLIGLRWRLRCTKPQASEDRSECLHESSSQHHSLHPDRPTDQRDRLWHRRCHPGGPDSAVWITRQGHIQA